MGMFCIRPVPDSNFWRNSDRLYWGLVWLSSVPPDLTFLLAWSLFFINHSAVQRRACLGQIFEYDVIKCIINYVIHIVNSQLCAEEVKYRRSAKPEWFSLYFTVWIHRFEWIQLDLDGTYCGVLWKWWSVTCSFHERRELKGAPQRPALVPSHEVSPLIKRVCKITKSDYQLRYVCPSVRSHGTTRLPLGAFAWYFI